MTIARFEFEDLRTGWKLEPVTFGGFNLLVGLSGAGKTSIVNALRDVRAAGLGSGAIGRHARWSIEIRAEDRVFTWTVTTAPVDASGDAALRFEEERIDADGEEIVRRSNDGFLFRGAVLPRLKDTESAIALLETEEVIAPLYRMLDRILLSEIPRVAVVGVNELALVEWLRDTTNNIAALREAMHMSVLIKAYVAREYHPRSFEGICERFRMIFPGVADVTVDRWTELDPQTIGLLGQNSTAIVLGVRERGSDQWITAGNISLGMQRTFFHLAELELSPSGTTIIVDEYENSMGVNCLPAVTDAFIERQPDIQFILTSHHPYVINNVPIDWWRVVTREGSTVRVREARDIPELNTKSRQDAFTLLTNSSVFEAGVP